MSKQNDSHQGDSHITKWLRLHLTERVGAVTFKRLLEYFGDIDAVLDADIGKLATVPSIGRKTAERIFRSRKEVRAEEELEQTAKHGIRLITLDSEEYPPLLKQIYDPPAVLYVKGDITRADNLSVAIVGSRTCSHYGQEQASRLAHMLAAAGFTIVSGLARGIDSAAHRGALAGGGRTYAVLGCGLSDIYPPENKPLADQIVGNGALLSELPLTYEPLKGTFHARNRIISGLSLGTIVVEAGRNSGAMITARFAGEHNREIMAVPGRIDAPGSHGPHQLIRDGAMLVQRMEDVLEALDKVGEILGDHAEKTARKAEGKVEPPLFSIENLKLSETEDVIFKAMKEEPVHIDHILSTCSLNAGKALSSLTSLQLKGLVKQMPGGYYTKRPVGQA